MRILSMECKNYRTLDDFKVEFDEHYTAICGKNDAGKSNIFRAFRFLSGDNDVFIPWRKVTPTIDLDEDFSKWAKAPDSEKSIRIEFNLEINEERDAGLHSFIFKHMEIKDKTHSFVMKMVAHKNFKESLMQYSVSVGIHESVGSTAQEIFEKIRSAQCIQFHDSSQHHNYAHDWYASRSIASRFGDDDRRVLEDIRKRMKSGLRRISKNYQQQLQDLLGRFDQKYKVNMEFPAIDFDRLPYSLSLGNSKFDVAIENWGSGTRNKTRILDMLFKAQQPDAHPDSSEKVVPVFLIEEPESFLHPSAQAEFSQVLQDLSAEFGVQVIITSHSPHMLSHTKPSSNVLLERRSSHGSLLGSVIQDSNGDHWMEPFAASLGISESAFAAWRGVIISDKDSIILVEGETDVEYLKLLQDEAVHGKNSLDSDLEFYPCGGATAFANQVLLKFVREKYKKIVILFDLDAVGQLAKGLETLGMKKGVHYLTVGRDMAGMKDVEGLLPNHIRQTVYGANSDIVAAAGDRTDKTAAKSARRTIKKKLLEEFKNTSQPGEDYALFYELSKKISEALKKQK